MSLSTSELVKTNNSLSTQRAVLGAAAAAMTIAALTPSISDWVQEKLGIADPVEEASSAETI